MTQKILLFLVIMIAGLNALAQETPPPSPPEEEKDYFSLSLEELMNIPVSVASKTELPIRESPGIISVITEQEIKNSGARDLIDVLSLVPGIQFGGDVQGVAGIGIRGNWAYEGKVLVLLDGQMMNEILYATVNLGNHFDVNNIDKVEVIRGPGSSIYGGFAELGVINIITKSGKKLSGGSIAGRYGQLTDTYGRRSISFAIGNDNDNIEYSINGFLNQGNRSSDEMTDYTGNVVNLADLNKINTNHINAALRIKNFKARLMYDQQKTETVVWYDSLLAEPTKMDFGTFNGELKYDANIGDKLTITPKINFNIQKPWETPGDATGGYDGLEFDVNATRINGNLNFAYKPNEKIDVAAGIDTYFDNAESLNSEYYHFSDSTTNTVDYNNVAGYIQARFITAPLTITAGARVDNHSRFGSAFSPRLGLNKTFNKLHMKLLYSRAFRAPSIENLNYSETGDLDPEVTEVTEFEIGYLIGSKMTIVANLYNIVINDPIIFTADGGDVYDNASKAGSVGFETEYKIKDKWGYFTLNYAYYKANNNEVVEYTVPQTDKSVLGHANSKLTAYASIKVTKNFNINPSIYYTGKRYAAIDPAFIEIDPIVNFNLFLNANNIIAPNLTIGIGIFDAFDDGLLFIQPYTGGMYPMPGTGREFVVKLSYDFKWK